MAHEIETIAYAHKDGANAEEYQVPWHGLGVKVRPDLSPQQMLKAAGLDWEVIKRPLIAEWTETKKVSGGTVKKRKTVNGKRITVEVPAEDGAEESIVHRAATPILGLFRSSDNQFLTTVSNDWHPTQNEEVFSFFNEFVLSGNMEMNTAGSLRNGKMVWALAKVKDEAFELFGGDRIESYLLFSNPHEYGKTIDIRFSPIRVVCNNTLTLALGRRGDMAVRLSHRKKFDPQMVKEALGIAHDKLNQYKEIAEHLGKKRWTVDLLTEYYQKLFPSKSAKEDAEQKLSRPASNLKKMVEEYRHPGAEFARGTWWQAFNAVTYALDHELGRSPENRIHSAWYGSNRHKKTDALELAYEMADKSPSN